MAAGRHASIGLTWRNVNHRLFEDGRLALVAGDVDRAIELLEQLTAADGSSTDAWFNLGLAYKLKRDWENSARCNRAAAEIEPHNEEAFWRWLCETCSLGSPHEHAGDAVAPKWPVTRRFGFAGAEADVVAILERWAAGGPGRSSSSLRESRPEVSEAP
jgi:tetratricopeptide (TPR) repeat protein